MSQQINLLLPELRPKRDWLAFPMVAGAALAGISLIAGLFAWGHYQTQVLTAAQAQSDAELKALQQQVEELGRTQAGRRPDPALQTEIDDLKGLLQQRDAVLSVVEAGGVSSEGGHAALMRGFARQVTEGVWLTAFSFSGKDVDIRGRLADPALLPQYIRRLNGESAFQGRLFAALDMKDGTPAAPTGSTAAAGTASAPTSASAPRYTEFVLHGNLPGSEGKAP